MFHSSIQGYVKTSSEVYAEHHFIIARLSRGEEKTKAIKLFLQN